MILDVYVEPTAEQEWAEAALWYEKQEPGVGSRFNQDVRDLLRVVAKQPDRFPKAGQRGHKAKVIGWPYSVYFIIDRFRNQVRVTAIWHGSRNPDRLRSRLE